MWKSIGVLVALVVLSVPAWAQLRVADGPGGMVYGQAGVQSAPAPGDGPVVMQFGPGVAEMQKEKAAYLGVTVSSANATLRQQLKVAAGTGLVVDFVDKGSPAEAAGLKPHDLMLKLNDQILINRQQLAVLVRTFKPGEEVAIQIVREGQPTKLTAKLVEKELPVLSDEPWNMERWQFQQELPPDVQNLFRGFQGRRFGAGAAGPGGGAAGGFGPFVGPMGQSVGNMVFADGQHTLRVTVTPDGQGGSTKHLNATDKSGKVLFDGSIDTEEQLKAVPPDIAAKLKNMGQINVHIDVGGATTRP